MQRKKIGRTLKNLTLTAMFIGIGLLLPFLTGQIPQVGSALLPMHIPALLCGVFCGPWYGLVCGAVMPLLRSSIFGMPPLFPTAIAMAFELAAYGLIIGLFYRVFKKNIIGLYASLLISMVGGRLVWGAVTAILLGINGGGLTFNAFLSGAVLTAIPGIILQLVLIPVLVIAVRNVIQGDSSGYNEIRELVKGQLKLYPKAKEIDILKAIYQNEFGAGHMISDSALCLKLVKDELKTLEENTGDPVEKLGGDLSRLHIRAIPQTGLSSETFAKIFMLTAVRARGNKESFLRKVNAFKKYCNDENKDFSEKSIDAAVEMWEAGGGGLFRHSDTFRNAYHPAYRVVETRFCDYLDAFASIDKRIREKRSDKPLVIAIDGRCGAGKTTLAANLALVYDCPVIPMDNFFPQDDGNEVNIDISRFKAEVLTKLSAGESFEYKPFDCGSGELAAPVAVTPGKAVIIEGSYSTYPEFADYIDLKIFMSVTPEQQLRRIKLRNPEQAEIFKKKWIPLEEEYFNKYDIEKKADIIYHNNKRN
jgi:uridine kinase/predicted membrane protein